MHPILFHIGNYPVRSFGLMILLAFLAGLWLIRRRSGRYGFDANAITDLAYLVLIFGVLGARLAFLIQEIPYYSKHPEKLLTLQFEGLTSFGGVVFGLLTVAWWTRKRGQSFSSVVDLLAPGFLLGHAIGRVGCFLNGCCFGGACDPRLPWATFFPRLVGPHHPAQIYDSLMNFAALGLILLFERRANRPGQVAAAMLMLHGITRFVYEFWRAGTAEQVDRGEASGELLKALPITQAQVAAGIMIVIGLVWFFAARPRAVVPETSEPQPA